MIVIHCAKHKQEIDAWNEAHGITPDSPMSEQIRVIAIMPLSAVEECPDCTLYGISRHTGTIGELESADDWFLS